MKLKLRFVVEDVDRHGNVRLYFRRAGQPKVRLPGPLGSPDFLAAYKAAVDGKPLATPKRAGNVAANSLAWLCREYYQTAVFKRLARDTQRVRRSHLDRFCAKNGDVPYKMIDTRSLRKVQDAMSDRPEAANRLIIALRQVYDFAVDYGYMDRNPAKGVPKINTGSEGHRPWTEAEQRKFEAFHAVGTIPRLVYSLLLHTGARISDVAVLGRQHEKDGWLTFTQRKDHVRNPRTVQIPIIPELRQIIDASPTGDLAYVVSNRGTPYVKEGLGNMFRKWCRQAGLPEKGPGEMGCCAHGLRKTMAIRLAESGATEQEAMAWLGHETSTMANHYARKANQRIRAANAADKLSVALTENKSVPLPDANQNSGTPITPKPLKTHGVNK